MKPNKYEALEFCRRAIRSCKTQEHSNGAFRLIFNFRRMFPYDLDLFNLLENELFHRRMAVMNEQGNKIGEDSDEKMIRLNEACELLKSTMYNDDVWGVIVSGKYHSVEEFVEDFKKAMNECEQ